MKFSREINPHPFLLSILLIATTTALTTNHVNAETMMNGNFQLEVGTLSPDGNSPTPTVQNDNEENNKLYTIKKGFDYKESDAPFTFTVSQSQINYGVFSPTNPIERFSLLTVDNRSSHGFSIFASQNHPLLDKNSTIIPDTTCDNGLCSEKKPSLWTNTLTYGFGYKCESLNCKDNTTDMQEYTQFPDEAKKEPPQTIISSSTGDRIEAKITYKVNIPGTQPIKSSYNNTVSYIAIPTF